MSAWTGILLRVDLAAKTVKKEPLNMKNAHEYVGARGLGTKYFCDEVDPKVDPLSPDNKLIYMTGPLTGTAAGSAGRFEVVAKAPLTGTIGAANSGGHFGPELKFAGYDGIIFENASETPVYLYINDDIVELRDATDLWGKTVYETNDILQEQLGNFKISCIGPPGENLCLYAGVINEKHRAAGRGGLGAVMGSKKLKAVAVRGTGSVTVARPKAFMDAITDARAKLQAHPVSGAGLGQLGTQILINIINESGALPLHNWRDGAVFDKADDTSGETLAKTYLVKNKGCFGCTIACSRVSNVPDGPFKSFGEGPEYEAGWSFGADCGVNDLAAIVRANHLCNEYGMDPPRRYYRLRYGAATWCTRGDVGFKLCFMTPKPSWI